MNIRRQVHNINALAPHLPEGNYLNGRIGFWGLVTAQNSLNNTVTVVSDTGYEFQNIGVISDEWVTVDDQKKYIPSTRNLPPKNSRVFVLTPTFSAVGAFVLCSGFSKGDENIRTLWAQSKSELEEKNNSRETKTQGGWDITEEYSNGNFSAESDDGKVKLNVGLVDKNSDKKAVTLDAWDNTITINEDGITIKDKNKNVIKMTNSDIQIIANGSSKIKIGNSLATIYSVIKSLLDKLNSGAVATAGSPAAHTITSGQFTDNITELGTVLKG